MYDIEGITAVKVIQFLHEPKKYFSKLFFFSSSNNAKLKNVDRENSRDIEVTVNGVTVTITDYKLIPKKETSTSDTQLQEEQRIPMPADPRN